MILRRNMTNFVISDMNQMIKRADAPGFGDRANKAVFPNQRVTPNATANSYANAATGGVNPRAGLMP